MCISGDEKKKSQAVQKMIILVVAFFTIIRSIKDQQTVFFKSRLIMVAVEQVYICATHQEQGLDCEWV